jgi:hypothetical protein
MIGLKRFIRPGFVISAAIHLGALLLFLGANAFMSTPPKAAPPQTAPADAMLVDIVPPKEAPRFEGNPADSTTSGSKSALNSDNASAAAQPTPTKPAAQSPQQPQPPQQPQERPTPQRDARPNLAQPQTSKSETTQPQTTQSQAEQSETGRDQTAQPQMAKSETGQAQTAQHQTTKSEKGQPEPAQPEMAKTQTSEPPPPPAEAEQPSAGEFARLALLGGQLGGGFEAPAIDAPDVGRDFTAAFRERVSSCSAQHEVNSSEKIAISLRVSFNPDGTLASPPQPNGVIASQKEAALVQVATRALEKCQPYTMLPPDKYQEWKTLDLMFYPSNFTGG